MELRCFEHKSVFLKRRIFMRLTAIILTFAALLIMIAPGTAAAQNSEPNRAKLLNPALLNETAPEKFQAKFETSKGDFVIEVTRAWSPLGADRFYNMVKNGYFDNCRFFRVVENFMVQFGMSGDPKITQAWRAVPIKDDPVKQSNKKGYVTFAKTGAPNSRTTQIFINFKDNAFLDNQGFSPIGKVIEGMDIVNSVYKGYGESPDQGMIQAHGNAYLQKDFPKLDFVKAATIIVADAK
jgi:peptidyl-prolyl cis-trans isomerase A (cyclophilin A)